MRPVLPLPGIEQVPGEIGVVCHPLHQNVQHTRGLEVVADPLAARQQRPQYRFGPQRLVYPRYRERCVVDGVLGGAGLGCLRQPE